MNLIEEVNKHRQFLMQQNQQIKNNNESNDSMENIVFLQKLNNQSFLQDLMDSEDSSGFTFGTIQDTLVVVDDNQAFLPYNPFAFDLHFTVTKSQPKLQPVGKDYVVQAGHKATFGRKKELVDIVLHAATISGRHFNVDQSQKIMDVGSLAGTFKWVLKDQPKILKVNDMFRLGPIDFTVTMVDLDNAEIIIRNEQSKQSHIIKRSNYLIGSHKSCHLVLKNINGFHAIISPKQGKLYSMVEDEDMSIENGVWQRLSASKNMSTCKQLNHGDYIMVNPYIFKIHY